VFLNVKVTEGKEILIAQDQKDEGSFIPGSRMQSAQDQTIPAESWSNSKDGIETR
jgi:hypothetical protein